MRILFEGYTYEEAKIKEVLEGLPYLSKDNKVTIDYVGYYYNTLLQDCVFILPKVLLKGKIGEELVFGEHSPLDVIDVKSLNENGMLTETEKSFIYGFAVWIYRAIVVYNNNKQNDTSIIYHSKIAEIGKGSKRLSNTYLDIILQLIQFNKDNKNFFFYILRNIRSGLNKINWTRTISKSSAIIQDGTPIYLNPINKKKQINFDEELLIIFYSILNHICEEYGFKVDFACNYELIKGRKFQTYINGYGKIRLRQIKYKYFSDKALELWNLCDAFFDHAKPVFVNKNKKEFLLAKDFNRVFEAIIDELVGDNPLPDGMAKKQDDGKIVDHLYTEQSLIENDNPNDKTYYIGDSKYYKIDNEITNESIAKQFTYARNVINWCFSVFGPDSITPSGVKLRDNITEGYNILPNFFISAKMDEEFRYDRDGIDRTIRKKQRHQSQHYENRIFDRDTLFVYHYDVNFLFVLSLYGRDNEAQKKDWKKKIRDIFKHHIQQWLQEDYDFYAMKSKGNALDGEQVINENFKMLTGKLFRPYEDSEIYSLSLKREKGKDTRDSDEYHLLEEHFVIVPIKQLGDNPQEELNEKLATYRSEHPYLPIPQSMLPLYPLERYKNENFVIGLYHNQAHWNWITGANDKGTLIYNVRLDPDRDGSMKKTTIRNKRVKFAFLYEEGKEHTNIYHVFRVHDYAVMNEDRMRKAEYPREPKGDYFIFRFDEEVSFGNIDIASLIEDKKNLDANYKYGTPIFKTGEELLEYRK